MPRKAPEDNFDPKIAVEQTKQVFLIGGHEAMQVAEFTFPLLTKKLSRQRETPLRQGVRKVRLTVGPLVPPPGKNRCQCIRCLI